MTTVPRVPLAEPFSELIFQLRYFSAEEKQAFLCWSVSAVPKGGKRSLGEQTYFLHLCRLQVAIVEELRFLHDHIRA